MHKIDICLCIAKTILYVFSDTLDLVSRSAKVAKVDESNAESAIESLQKQFKHVLIATTEAIEGVPVKYLNVRINYFLSHQKHNSALIEDHLMKLESIPTAEGLLNYLIRNHFIGYWNYELIRIFQEETESEKLNDVIEEYDKCHFDSLNVNFNDIIQVFRERPDLIPKYPIGFPEIRIHLKSEWEKKTVYEWNEFLQKRFTWPRNLIISGISRKCIFITYAVLPFSVTSIMRDLKNPHILEELDSKGVRLFQLRSHDHDVASQMISMPVVSSVTSLFLS